MGAITFAEAKKLNKRLRTKKNKYSAKKTDVDGITFHSRKEARRYKALKLLQAAGEIKNLELQPEFPIWINGEKAFTYKGDFSYFTNEGRVIEDVKGVKTALYRLKSKCVRLYYGIKITEI